MRRGRLAWRPPLPREGKGTLVCCRGSVRFVQAMRSRHMWMGRGGGVGSGEVRQRDEDDAIFIVALQRYMITRAQHGEQVSELAAMQLAARARDMGLAPDPRLANLGFSLVGTFVGPAHRDTLLAALRVVRRSDLASEVQRLCGTCLHVSVKALEREASGSGG